MMLTFLATFAVFLLVVLGMSLGWIIKRKSIQGSCGGISALGMEKVCDCPEPCDARKKRMARESPYTSLLAKDKTSGHALAP